MLDIAGILRRIKALEAKHSATLRFGHVVSIEDNGTVRVQLADGQNVVSAPLQTLQRRVLKDKEIKLPDIGEPVAVLFSGQAGGQETGVVLGAVYSLMVPDPKQKPHMEFSRFEDGTTLSYDRKTHVLYADVKGDVEIKTTGNVSVDATGDVNVKTSGNLNAEATGDVNVKTAGSVSITAQKSITLKSSVSVNIDAPRVTIPNGSLDVKGDIKSNEVSLKSHTHPCKEGGTNAPSGA